MTERRSIDERKQDDRAILEAVLHYGTCETEGLLEEPETGARNSSSPSVKTWTRSLRDEALRNGRASRSPPRRAPPGNARRRGRGGRGDRELRASKRVTKAVGEVHLTPTEWHIVELLVRNPGEARDPATASPGSLGPRNTRRRRTTCACTSPSFGRSSSPGPPAALLHHRCEKWAIASTPAARREGSPSQ
jgi:hypothetical protein